MEEKKIRPQDKWNAKAGLISKSYKLKRELVDQFAAELTKMMNAFIEEQNNE